MEDFLKQAQSMVSFLSKAQANLEGMKKKHMENLDEEGRAEVRRAEKVAKQFADNNDLEGLLNYANSIQEKIMNNASTDRDKK